MAEHTRNAQAAARHYAMVVVIAIMKFRVGHNRLARNLVKRYVLCGQVGRGGNHQRMAYTVRIVDCPLQGLHPAKAAANHSRQLSNPQIISKARLRSYPVLNRYNGESCAPR